MKKKYKVLNKGKIDLLEILSLLIYKKYLIIKVVIFFIFIGLIDIFTQPVIYRSSSTFYPHYQNNNSNRLNGLANLAGVNIQNQISSNNLPLNLYPDLINSIDFKNKILNQEVTTNDSKFTYREYLNNKKDLFNFRSILNIKKLLLLPINFISKINKENTRKTKNNNINNLKYISNDDYDLYSYLDNNIILNINDSDGIIQLSVLDENPEISATITNLSKEILQESIINFKIKNIKEVYNFTSNQLEIARINLFKLQDSIATFKDGNKNIRSDLFLNQLERLETEYNISRNIYNELAITKEKTAIDVKKNTPIFTIINSVYVPLEKHSPKRSLILTLYIFLGLFLACFWVLFKKTFLNIISLIKN